MTDLHEHFERIAGPAAEPTPQQASDDVARGRRALRRRRTLQQAGVSAFVVAAIAAGVTYGSTQGSAEPPLTPPQAIPQTQVAARLVAYQGEQPAGFKIDKVPDGWEVQGVTPSALTIAPIGAADQEPASFVGKIAVMLQSVDDHSTPQGTAVTVAGRPGVINKPDDVGTKTKNLWVQQPNGDWMQVQIWDASGWSQAEIVEFGAGIHVLKDAVKGHG